MPRKSKKAKFKPYRVRVNQYGEIFTNTGAVGDGTSPVIALKYLIEIFSDRLDKDVIKLVFDECDFNVDQASETLMSLCNDDSREQPKDMENVHKMKTEEFIGGNDSFNYNAQNYSDPSISNFDTAERMAFPNVFCKSQSFTNISSESFMGSPVMNVQNEIFYQNEKQSSGSSWNYDATSNQPSQQQAFVSELFVPDPCNIILNTTSIPTEETTNPSNSVLNLYETFQTTPPRFIVPSLPMHGSPSPRKSPGSDASRKVWNSSDTRHFSSSANKDSYIKKDNVIKEVSEKIQCGNHILIILRGLPGSGKSSLALKLKFSGVIFSTDDFFVRRGKYIFDPNKLSEAHEWNKLRTKKALEKRLTPIIIDNTNTEAWEMKPYVIMGKRYNYEIVILEPDTPWKFNVNCLALRSKHGVPKSKIAKMKERYQKDITVEKIMCASNLFSSEIGDAKNNDIIIEDPNNDDSCVVKDNHISLKAIIHTEENSSTEDSLSFLGLNLTLPNDKENINCNSKDEMMQSCLSSFENLAVGEINATCNFKELQALAKNDSEDSQSYHSSTNGSCQEISGWEAITEPDNDFQWSTSLSELKLNTNLPCKSKSAENLFLKESTDSSCVEDITSSYSSSENISYTGEDSSVTDKTESQLLKIDIDLHIKEMNHIYSERIDIISNSDLNYSHQNTNDSSMSDIPKDENMNEKIHSLNDNYDTKFWIGYKDDDVTQITTKLSGFDVNKSEDTELITPKESLVINEETFINVRSGNQNSTFTPKPQRNNCNKLSTFNKNTFSDQLFHDKLENTENSLNLNDNSDWSLIDGTTNELDIETPSEMNTEALSTPKPQREIFKNAYSVLENQSKCIIKNQKSILNVSLDSIGDSWTFPELVINSSLEQESIRKKPLSFKMSAYSQTEPRDFDFLYKIPLENSSTNLCGYDIITAKACSEAPGKINLMITEEFATCNCTVMTYDKSTNTDDLVDDIEISQKLVHLQSCFPDISKDDLLHLLEICYNDERWISNLLLDWGYKYNVPTENCDEINFEDQASSREKKKYNVNSYMFEEGIEFSAWKTSALSKSNADISSDTDNRSSSSKSPSEESKETQPTEEKTSEQTKKLQLVLDPLFAQQLENLFGPVPCSGNRKVDIDFEFAKLIYEKWRNTEQETFEDVKSILNNSKQLKHKKNKKRNSRTPVRQLPSPLNGLKESSSFTEIMDMEFACQLHKEETLKKDDNFKIKMKRSELYNMFPGADIIVLDEIFESNNYSLEDSLHILGADITQQENIEKTENVKRFDAQIKEWERTTLFREFESGDWSSWVYQDENVSFAHEATVTDPSTISSDAAELRETAAKHYQLRQEYIQKAQAAYCRGMKDVASFYAQQGSEEGRIAKDTNKLAAALIARERNSANSLLKLDLHGLHVQEAISLLEKFLCDKKLEIRRRQHSNPVIVTIVTGQGLHSAQGAKLRPAVINYLKNCKYNFTEIKTGLIEVTLMSG